MTSVLLRGFSIGGYIRDNGLSKSKKPLSGEDKESLALSMHLQSVVRSSGNTP